MHKQLVRYHPAYALLWVFLTSACVDEFEGSNVLVDFGPLMPAQVRSGAAPIPGLQHPTNTHYRLYGLTTDAAGQPLAAPVQLFQFEIHPIVELASPCLIDPEETRFPGIHVTKFAERMALETGIVDIANPPANATEGDKIDMATAQQRIRNLLALGRPPTATDSGALKAITSASTAVYPAPATACVEDLPTVDPSLIPPSTCIGDESNRNRLRLCNEFWAANPSYYEGSDRILTEPLAGEYFGLVFGANPVSGTVLGGVQFQIPQVIEGFTAFAYYLQFDDLTGDGVPDYPMTIPFNDLGFRQLLVGRPSFPARGVTRVQMANFESDAITPPALKARLTSQMVIFSNLGEDDLHF